MKRGRGKGAQGRAAGVRGWRGGSARGLAVARRLLELEHRGLGTGALRPLGLRLVARRRG